MFVDILSLWQKIWIRVSTHPRTVRISMAIAGGGPAWTNVIFQFGIQVQVEAFSVFTGVGR